MKISTVGQMREMDRTAIADLGIPEEVLMENAGIAACTALSRHIGIKNRMVAIFCGAGSNGGDGLVIARKLHSVGSRVKIFLLSDPEKYKGAAETNYRIVSRLAVDMQAIESAQSLDNELIDCDAIVDAIFGTGLSRNVEGLYREVIEKINLFGQKGKLVLSLDIPSGVNGDNGQIMGIAVKADLTVTFGSPKVGNLLYPGYDLGGKLYAAHISFPPSLHDSDEIKIAVNLPRALPLRNPSGHKGSFGDVLFIGGAASYYGAPYFAAHAFLKAGGGYSRLAAPGSMIPVIAAKAGEIVFVPQKETNAGSIAMTNKNDLLALSRKTDMTVLGPGLSLNEESQELARQLAAEITSPLLLDGDAITALRKDRNILTNRKFPTVLTPHLGEMSRLSDKSAKEIEDDRIGILRQMTAKLNAIIVLKGPHSLIGFPDGSVYVNMSGNAGMATAGSGDVLCGTIAAMHGLCSDMETAVRKGVFIHGLAGDLAAEELGKDGMTAQDILDFLPYAMKLDREGGKEQFRELYNGPEII